jgi:hypothetical protein
MKTLKIEKLVMLAIVAYSAGSTGCSMMPGGNNPGVAASGGSSTGSNETTSGTTTAGTTAVTSFSTTAANADNVTGRILNALTLPATTATPTPTSLVSLSTGNFATVNVQQSANLSTTTDPATATGAGAPPLLAYAACNDVKATSYGVTTTSSIATETTLLVAAGLTIVNQCTAGLAASGTTLNPQVSSIFSTLVSQDSTSGATTAQAFISVCTAATSFCVSMLSF